jgi:hypothetical protein
MEGSRDRVDILGVGNEGLNGPEALDSIVNSTSPSESNMTVTTTMRRS